MKNTLHRDCFRAVMAEYKRIDAKNPTADTDVKMQFAKDYVRAKALADTIEMFRIVYGAQ